ncbi:spondin domain-containing protein [Gilvimarinus polysaccharolyticus]|uniref:spondin domain-containing protein n=1 Tax=Gilvimarinus polysaccharolyticus TaxID=863921 RepID=UPI000673451E|nr:spondin domain-containing protein [Gilvimarinus polysaccharolyticus]
MNKHYILASLCVLSLTLTACGSDDDHNDTMVVTPTPEPVPTPTPEPEPVFEPFIYAVKVTNITRGQPLSPLAAMIFNGEYQMPQIGEPASVALEVLAESGDNSQWLQAAMVDEHVYMSTSAEGGPLLPGASTTVMLEVDPGAEVPADMYLGLVSMLANTNDGITMLDATDLAQLQVDESASWTTLSYDTGTELNSESADTIIGPAAAGGLQEGFNAVRDDIVDELRLHSGVISYDDGLMGSALSEAQRFDNPVMRVDITRMQ